MTDTETVGADKDTIPETKTVGAENDIVSETVGANNDTVSETNTVATNKAEDVQNDTPLDDYEIKIVTPDMAKKALDFTWKYFYPDEPLSRSVKVKRGSLSELMFSPYIGKGYSLAAVDTEDKIIGLRIGKLVKADAKIERFFETNSVVMSCFNALAKLTGQVPKADVVPVFMDRIGYYPYKLMDRTGAKKIYGALCICTSTAARGKGLGTKLVAESIELAKKEGCEYMYVLVTGNYSAKIFDKLGFSVESELKYSEFVDGEGKPLLDDTREHVKAQIRLLKLL